MGVEVLPASTYFDDGRIMRGAEAGSPPRERERPSLVTLRLADSSQLPMAALARAFGKGKPYFVFDGGLAQPRYFPWKSQPKGPIRCRISASEDFRTDDGQVNDDHIQDDPKHARVMDVTIHRW